MKHSFEHYVSKILSYLWFAAVIVGSITLLIWLIKMFLKVIGVL